MGSDGRTSPRASHESAFTLIELVIGLVLLALLFAAIFPALTNLTTRSDRSSSTSISTSDTSIAARLFESDMRQIRGNRGTDDVFVSTSSTIASLSSTNGATHDIVVASPTRLVVNADVLDTGVTAIERVTWELVSDGTAAATCGTGSTWCFVRTVTNAAATTTLSSEVVTHGSGTAPTSRTCTTSNTTADPLPDLGTSRPRVFCYQEAIISGVGAQYNKFETWTPACTQTWRADQTSSNANYGEASIAGTTPISMQHNAVDALASISPLDRIVTIGGVLYADSKYRNTQERSYENVSVSVRSREGRAYRQAILCGYRQALGS